MAIGRDIESSRGRESRQRRERPCAEEQEPAPRPGHGRRQVDRRRLRRDLRGRDPATGEVLAHVPRMGAAETRRAIEAAADAYPAWRRCSRKERARDPAPLGRPDARARRRPGAAADGRAGQAARRVAAEVAYAASFLEWFGEEAKRVYGDTIPTYMQRPARSSCYEAAGRRHAPGSRRGTSPRRCRRARPRPRSRPAARWC